MPKEARISSADGAGEDSGAAGASAASEAPSPSPGTSGKSRSFFTSSLPLPAFGSRAGSESAEQAHGTSVQQASTSDAKAAAQRRCCRCRRCHRRCRRRRPPSFRPSANMAFASLPSPSPALARLGLRRLRPSSSRQQAARKDTANSFPLRSCAWSPRWLSRTRSKAIPWRRIPRGCSGACTRAAHRSTTAGAHC